MKIEKLQRVLSHLPNGRLATLGVPGNHDYGNTWRDGLIAARIFPAVSETGMSEAAIALCHNPDAMDDLSWGDYAGWILAGHTHGGQCKPPFLPPPVLPVKNRRYTSGEIEVGAGRRLYISRGVGQLLKARFNVRPEITVFTLRTA